MPVRIHCLDDGKGIEFLATGTVHGKDVIEANEKIYTPETLEWLEYKVIDRTQCTRYDVTSGEVRTIVEQDLKASAIKPGLCMILVSVTPIQLGMSRMWQILAGEADLNVQHFNEREEADAFIARTFGQPGRS